MNISFGGFKLNVEILILICVIYLILVGHTFFGCCNCNLKEAFNDPSGNVVSTIKTDLSNNNITTGTIAAGNLASNIKTKEPFVGQSTPLNLNSNSTVNTTSWSTPDMSVTSDASQQHLLMFSTIKFKPECCPNSLSTSSGCACMTGQQYNYLAARGGNNVPYSEY